MAFRTAFLAAAVVAAGAHGAPATRPAHPPSGAFIDISVSVMGASLGGDYTRAEKAVGAMIENGEACVAAGRPRCVVSGDGVEFDLSTGRHVVSLLAKAGYVTRDRRVAAQDGTSTRIVDGGAYLWAVNVQKIHVIEDYRRMCGIR